MSRGGGWEIWLGESFLWDDRNLRRSREEGVGGGGGGGGGGGHQTFGARITLTLIIINYLVAFYPHLYK